MRILICLAALLATAAAVTAGPIREAIREFRENRPGIIIPKRAGGSCGSCGSSAPAQQYSAPASACPGGACPLPAASAPASRVTRYTTVCEGGRCVLVPVRE